MFAPAQDKLVWAAGDNLCSMEHDGVCVFREAIPRVLEAAGNVKMAVKELPKAYVFAAEMFPDFDWSLKASMPYGEFAELRALCGRHLHSGEARANTADFADFVAAMLEPVIHIPHEQGERRVSFELFVRGFWAQMHRDDAVACVQRTLKSLACPARGGPWVPQAPLNEVSFARSLCEAVLARLPNRSK